MGKSEDSRQSILEKALKVFIRKGYNGTSLTDLCKATGFTKGALYHHFSNKEDLYRHAVDLFFSGTGMPEWLTRSYPTFRERLLAGFTSVDASRRWIEKTVAMKTDDAILLFYSFLYGATRRYPVYQKAIDRHDAAKRELLASHFEAARKVGELRKDIDPALLSLELDALLQQLVYLRFVNPAIKADSSLLERLAVQYWDRIQRN